MTPGLIIGGLLGCGEALYWFPFFLPLHTSLVLLSHIVWREEKMEFFDLSASSESGVFNSLIETFENLQRKNNRPPYYPNGCPALLGLGTGPYYSSEPLCGWRRCPFEVQVGRKRCVERTPEQSRGWLSSELFALIDTEEHLGWIRPENHWLGVCRM